MGIQPGSRGKYHCDDNVVGSFLCTSRGEGIILVWNDNTKECFWIQGKTHSDVNQDKWYSVSGNGDHMMQGCKSGVIALGQSTEWAGLLRRYISRSNTGQQRKLRLASNGRGTGNVYTCTSVLPGRGSEEALQCVAVAYQLSLDLTRVLSIAPHIRPVLASQVTAFHLANQDGLAKVNQDKRAKFLATDRLPQNTYHTEHHEQGCIFTNTILWLLLWQQSRDTTLPESTLVNIYCISKPDPFTARLLS